jgi:hypothetical protein
MRVFHFLNEEFGLKVLKERRLKIARIMELNDPFELLGVDLSDCAHRRIFNETKETLSKSNGLLCFSKNWQNPVLWGHYANKHRGISLGFDIPQVLPTKVDYVKMRFQSPLELDEAFMKKLLVTKFIHWAYEEEYRIYVSLEDEREGLFYADFSDSLVLRQVIVGAQSQLTRSQISAALGDLCDKVEVFKARAAFKSFKVVRNKDDSLWV